MALAAAVGLAGCGGGGGSDAGGGGGSVPVQMSLTATVTGLTTVRLTWSAASTVTDYRIYLNGAYTGTTYPPDTSATLFNLTPDTPYCFVVYAYAFLGGTVARTNEVCVRTPASVHPSVPAQVTAVAVSPGQVTVSWAASSGDLSGYRVYRDSVLVGSPATVGFNDGGLAAATRYCYSVSAFDPWGFESARSGQACATTPPDSAPPGVPAGLRAVYDPQSAASPAVDVSWTAATDDSGTVTRYRVYRDGALAGEPTTTRFTDAGRSVRTQYCYTVTAMDSTGNESAPAGPECVTTSWVSVVVDDASGVEWTALAVDTADHLHVGYYDGRYTGSNQQVGTVNYATDATGSWQLQPVGSVAPTVYASLAIQATTDGRIHMAWYDFQTYRVLHGIQQGGTWSTEVIASNALNVTTVAMARDADNHLHVLYNPGGQVTYATNASGSWASEVIGNNGVIYGSATTAAIAVAPSGKVHVGYYDYAARVLKYVTNVSGSWVTETADGQADVGLHPAIALDGDGNPQLACYDVTNADLRHASRTAGGWSTRVLDSAGDVGVSVGMTADAAGHLHISYTDVTNRALKYATNASGAWQTYVIDSSTLVSGPSGSPPGYTAIAVDSAGRVHISYRGDSRLRVVGDH